MRLVHIVSFKQNVLKNKIHCVKKHYNHMYSNECTHYMYSNECTHYMYSNECTLYMQL